MQFSTNFSYLLALFTLAGSANAHGVIVAVKGGNGVTGQGFGVIPSTPRNGTTPVPFQQDTSIIKDAEITAGTASVCGRTLAGGINHVSAQLNAAVQAGLPSINDDGTVHITLHQVNSDGAGPYYCAVSVDEGKTFTAMTVSTNIPGTAGISTAAATDFPLVAKMPSGVQCTSGPNKNACLIRCRNGAPNGPFGGCMAVTNPSYGKHGYGYPDPYHKDSSSSPYHKTHSDSNPYHKTHSKHHHHSASSSSNPYYASSSTNNYYTTSSPYNYHTTSSSSNPYYTSSSANAYQTSCPHCTATVTVTETVSDCQATSTPAYGYGTTTSSAYKSYKTQEKCTGSSCKKQYAKRDLTEDSELSGDDAEFDDVPLEVADRLLAADLERYRSRSKRLAERLERVKRMRVAGGLE